MSCVSALRAGGREVNTKMKCCPLLMGKTRIISNIQYMDSVLTEITFCKTITGILQILLHCQNIS